MFFKKVKGSYTVEAALLSGLWLLVIFSVLLLLLGTHGRVYDTGKAYEAAVYAGTAGVCEGDGEKYAEEKLRAEKGFQVSGKEEEILVRFENKFSIPFGGLQWQQTGSAQRKIIRPVEFIEKVRRSRRFLENFTEGGT